MRPGGLYAWYAGFRERADARSMAVLISTSGAIPLPVIALLSPSFVREGSAPYLIAVWAATTTIFLVTAVVGRLSDRMFSVLGLVGMVGIAVAAYLVTAPAAARGIVTLLSAIPAIAAMASSTRVILGHKIIAVALAWSVSIAVAESRASALVSCAVSVAVIWLPVFMIGTLRRSLEFSRARYRELAHTGPLTGLPNRRGFLDRVERYVHENSTGTEEVGFLVIDVDLSSRSTIISVTPSATKSSTMSSPRPGRLFVPRCWWAGSAGKNSWLSSPLRALTRSLLSRRASASQLPNAAM